MAEIRIEAKRMSWVIRGIWNTLSSRHTLSWHCLYFQPHILPLLLPTWKATRIKVHAVLRIHHSISYSMLFHISIISHSQAYSSSKAVLVFLHKLMEPGSPKGGAPMHYYSPLLVDPSRKQFHLHTPAGGKQIFSLPSNSQPVRNCHSANESCHHPELPLFSSELCSEQPLSTSSSFLYERKLLSFVLWTCLWFIIVS